MQFRPYDYVGTVSGENPDHKHLQERITYVHHSTLRFPPPPLQLQAVGCNTANNPAFISTDKLPTSTGNNQLSLCLYLKRKRISNHGEEDKSDHDIAHQCDLFASAGMWTLSCSSLYFLFSVSVLVWHSLTSFMLVQKKTRVRIWLYEDARMQIEGQIIGFDEYMNMVLDLAVEIDSKRNTRTEVGRILLKGDSITLLQ